MRLPEKLSLSTFNLPTLSSIQLPGTVKELIKTLIFECTEIYLVGGFIRDLLCGIISTDLDFVVIDKSSEDLCKVLVDKYGGSYFVLDEDMQTTRFVLKDESLCVYTFDFTNVLRGNLEADFARRDFTINTIAINLHEADFLIDRFSGIADLKQKKIRAVNVKNLLDDPLRFIRAFRFATSLGGEIDLDTLGFIKNNCSVDNSNDLLAGVSGERIAIEMWKILDMDYSFKYIKQMSDSGLLEVIFPELRPMRKVTPNNFHHLWLYDHSLELIKYCEENLYKIPSWAREELDKSYGTTASPTKKSVSKLACLFHDIGKPSVWEIKEVGNGKEKHTFYGHDKVGVEISKIIFERLKFSNSITNTISKLIRYHLRPFQLSQEGQAITQKALYRFFKTLGDDLPLLLILAMADLYATQGPEISKNDLVNGEKLILYLFDEYKKYEIQDTEKSRAPKLLDGNEIMQLTGLKPSPMLGKLIKELDEAIAIGEVKTKEDAKEFIFCKLKLKT